MNRIEITKKIENKQLVLTLPEEYNNKDVDIIISEHHDVPNDESNWAELPAEKRLEILKTFEGGDKFPYIKVGKYDVYYQ